MDLSPPGSQPRLNITASTLSGAMCAPMCSCPSRISSARASTPASARRAGVEQTQTGGGETGNLAEAAFSISGVFESAQRAAERYLADVKSARGDADAILSSAREQAAQIERDAQDKANAREQAADESIRAKEAEFQKRCNCVVSSYEALRSRIGDDSRPASADSKI